MDGVAALCIIVLRLSPLFRLVLLGVLPEVADELPRDRLLSLWPPLELLFLVRRRGAGLSCASVKSVWAGEPGSSPPAAMVEGWSGLELGIEGTGKEQDLKKGNAGVGGPDITSTVV